MIFFSSDKYPLKKTQFSYDNIGGKHPILKPDVSFINTCLNSMAFN